MAEFESDAVELDARSAAGMTVLLVWHPSTDGLTVCVHDERNGEGFDLVVEARNALDAFRHPYAYYAQGTRELVAR